MKKAFFFCLFFLCGCASSKVSSKIWFNPTRNYTQAQADLHNCQESGEVPAPKGAPDQEAEQSGRESDPISACMKARGYYQVNKKFDEVYRGTE